MMPLKCLGIGAQAWALATTTSPTTTMVRTAHGNALFFMKSLQILRFAPLSTKAPRAAGDAGPHGESIAKKLLFRRFHTGVALTRSDNVAGIVKRQGAELQTFIHLPSNAVLCRH